MNNQIQLFEGQRVKVKTDEGTTLINLVHVAKCCGIIKRKNEVDYIRWNGKGGVVEKITNLSSEVSEPKIKDEITYILEEIENTDDRNSIYMSSWLSKRLAIECHSEKANRFKNWLVSLDEARENGVFERIKDAKTPNIATMNGRIDFTISLLTSLPNDKYKNRTVTKVLNFIGFEREERQAIKFQLSVEDIKMILAEFMAKDDVILKNTEYGIAVDRVKLYKHFEKYGFKWTDTLKELDNANLIYHKPQTRTMQIRYGNEPNPIRVVIVKENFEEER
ncbi:hypothetical protein [Clostridium neonatale]|uniref:hypothetical protein n=1 Tax=Clostridium neonatale TaxID=137838 RepID=UPI001D1FA925|nr:hypothetical protein [Clostridium neonatale]CAG9706451.1 conserved hypothetical protein [Clostridium neonatale]